MLEYIGVTGTRLAKDSPDLRAQFATYLGLFPTATFYLGGAGGIDSHALRWLASNTLARLRIALPNRLADQPITAQEAIEYASKIADVDVYELRFGVSPDCYHLRNEHIVHRSELVIGFPAWQPTAPRDIAPHRGGTWSTLRFAESLGTPFLVSPVRLGATP